MGVSTKKDNRYYWLFSYLWIVALVPKFVQLPILMLLVVCLWPNNIKKQRLDGFALLQVLVIILHFASIGLNAFFGTHELSRVFAALNTALSTTCAVLLYIEFKTGKMDFSRAGKYCFFNMLILISFYFLYIVARPYFDFSILGRNLYGWDLLYGQDTVRFLGYLDYANMVVIFVLINFPLSLYHLQNQKHVGVWTVVYMVLTFALVKATNSRSGVLLAGGIIVAYILLKYCRLEKLLKKKNGLLLLLACLIFCGIVLFLMKERVLSIVQSLLAMRTGSNSDRMNIYTESIIRMWNESPIIGIGIKDMLETGYPYGSHSSVLGYFYKTGIIGGVLYLCSFLILTVKVLRTHVESSEDMLLKVAFLAVLALMLLEDIDGTDWSVCLFYSLTAMAQKVETEKKQCVTGFKTKGK